MSNTSKTTSATILENLPLLFYSIAVILHTVGITLLVKLKRKRHQDLIIMHLSVTELFMCLLDIAQNVIMRNSYVTPVTSEVVKYIILVNCCLFVVPSFLIIITLTLDRFMEVYLNIRYHLYFKSDKVKWILVTNWIVGVALGAVLITLRAVKGTSSLKIVYLVVFPCLQILFLVIATSTYAYIYRKFKNKFKRLFLGKVSPASAIEQTCHYNNNNNTSSNNNRNVTTPGNDRSLPPIQGSTPYGIAVVRSGENDDSNNNITNSESYNSNNTNNRYNAISDFKRAGNKVVMFNELTQLSLRNDSQSPSRKVKKRKKRRRKVTKSVPFKRRNFFAPSLIVFSFILFVVIPDMLNLLINYMKIITGTESTQNILLCLYSIGFITDGIIYIFLQNHLRTMLMKLLSRKKWIRHVTITSMREKAHETSR